MQNGKQKQEVEKLRKAFGDTVMDFMLDVMDLSTQDGTIGRTKVSDDYEVWGSYNKIVERSEDK